MATMTKSRRVLDAPAQDGRGGLFLREHWYVVAWSDEVGRKPLARVVLGDYLLLYRTEDGRAVALENRCPHRNLPLSEGRLVGDSLECGYHGMTYAPSGACIRIPGQTAIPAQARVHAYPAVDHIGLVWIWPGDPALADTKKLFSLPPYGAPGWTANKGPYTYIKAAYQQLTDNLLDPAHVSFVHLSSLGSATMADIPVETRQDGDAVTTSRWTLDQPPVPATS